MTANFLKRRAVLQMLAASGALAALPRSVQGAREFRLGASRNRQAPRPSH